jgi:nitrate/TMAO reductase-like tetraheme cytochrome c subunit
VNSRKILLLLLVLAIAGGVVALSTPPSHTNASPKTAQEPATAPAQGTKSAAAVGGAARPAFSKATDCRACHEALYDEFVTSMHAQAWTDPMVQALSNGFRMSECIDCHAPMPIFETGIGARVAPRQHSRADGIDCITCHLMPDGVSVAATHAVDTSKVAGACRPVLVPELSTAAACAGCHNQHQTVDELAASGVKETCGDCHMPTVDRSGKPGRSHVFPGGHSLEMHQRAAKLELSIRDGALVATVTNVGAGHQIPTDARHRSYNLYLSAWDDRGNPLVADKMIKEFRLYYRDDFRPSTQIAHGKSGEGSWPLPEGVKGRIKVRLVYALNPEELAKKNVLTVVEKEIEFK